jgi:hypothetical protein
MFAWLTCAVLVLAAPQRGGSTPDEQQVVAAVAEIERGLASPKASESAAVLKKHASLADARDAGAIAEALKDARADVRLEAIDALGRNALADAFTALASHYAAEKKSLRKDERALPQLLLAVARHREPRAIAILTDDVQAQLKQRTITARILGLANIRTDESLAALFTLMDKLGFLEQNTHAEDSRLALMVLTGEDRGRSLEAWRKWWAESSKTFKVAAEPAELPKPERERWRAYWGAHSDEAK